MTSRQNPGSFRDPSGAVFSADGAVYRQVNEVFRTQFERFEASGLYDELVSDGLLVAHEEAPIDLRLGPEAYKVIRPEQIPFVSYPYEWSFGQLKLAAQTTLRIQRAALERGMTLKDASAYNIQFVGSRATLIDTLSFEIYQEGKPWIAYRQFCQHFLAPLALMSRVDVRLGQLLEVYLDGIPLDLASALLPARSKLSPTLLAHVHMHARSQKRYADKPTKAAEVSISKRSIVGLLESLDRAVAAMTWEPQGTEWADYYEKTNYVPEAMRRKAEIVSSYLERCRPKTVWDLGANTGFFSRLGASERSYTVAFDVDPAAVERNFRQGREAGETNLLPLLLDATNPHPGIGWENAERSSLLERGPADAMLALALVHHLAIGNNVPLSRIAKLFARVCSDLVVEFVPKEDSQVQRLLASREDVFPDYDREGFEASFRGHFSILDASPIEGSERTLYLMRAKAATGERELDATAEP